MNKVKSKDLDYSKSTRLEEVQQDIMIAQSGVACDRLIALHRFKELFAKNKRLIALQNLEDPYY
jgi:hypothetical protein